MNINYQQIFEKSVINLNAQAIVKLIDTLTIENLNDFKDKKTPASAIVTVNDQLNFVIMFFYWSKNKMLGFQYVLGFNVDQQNTEILCALFSKHVARMQRITNGKNTHSIKNLTEYYALQIKGYKEHLKKPKQ